MKKPCRVGHCGLAPMGFVTLLLVSAFGSGGLMAKMTDEVKKRCRQMNHFGEIVKKGGMSDAATAFAALALLPLNPSPTNMDEKRKP